MRGKNLIPLTLDHFNQDSFLLTGILQGRLQGELRASTYINKRMVLYYIDYNCTPTFLHNRNFYNFTSHNYFELFIFKNVQFTISSLNTNY